MRIVVRFGMLAMLLANVVLMTPTMASEKEARANDAVTTILFDEDADEFTSYHVDERGSVDINFARNTPDDVYSQLLTKLKNHPDIDGVLAGKSGPACSRF